MLGEEGSDLKGRILEGGGRGGAQEEVEETGERELFSGIDEGVLEDEEVEIESESGGVGGVVLEEAEGGAGGSGIELSSFGTGITLL